MSAGITKFWMIYGIGQGAPTAKHHSKEAARNEAGRLALRHPGATFVVLSAVDAFVADIPPIRKVEITKTADRDNEIPF